MNEVVRRMSRVNLIEEGGHTNKGYLNTKTVLGSFQLILEVYASYWSIYLGANLYIDIAYRHATPCP